LRKLQTQPLFLNSLDKFVQSLGRQLPIFGKPGGGYDEIRLLANKVGVNFVDLFPAFLAGGDNLYFPHDMHWSANGSSADVG